jgi:hypothetical protein
MGRATTSGTSTSPRRTFLTMVMSFQKGGRTLACHCHETLESLTPSLTGCRYNADRPVSATIGDTVSWRESTARVEPGSCSNNTNVHFFLQEIISATRYTVKPPSRPSKHPTTQASTRKAPWPSRCTFRCGDVLHPPPTLGSLAGASVAVGGRAGCSHVRLAPQHRHPHSSSGSCTRHPHTPERTGVPT